LHVAVKRRFRRAASIVRLAQWVSLAAGEAALPWHRLGGLGGSAAVATTTSTATAGNTSKLPHHSSVGMLFARTDLVPLSAASRKLLHEHYHPLHGLQGLFVLPTSELGQRGNTDW
jgi:hypothetical protein